MTDLKHEILDLPRALNETLEKGQAEYEAVARRTRWGEGPIYIVGASASYYSGLTGAYAFEGLLGWPVIVRQALVFKAYSVSVLRPRSVVLALAPSGDDHETLETVRAARSRGAVVLAVTKNPASELAQGADDVFFIRACEESPSGIKTAVCEQAALSYIGLIAARVLKRHHPQLDTLEREFDQLPKHVEWVLSQIPDALRSMARELMGARRLSVIGAGFYHPTALHWTSELGKLAGLDARGYDWPEYSQIPHGRVEDNGPVVLLSGSHCRLKKEIHQGAARLRKVGMQIYSITDTNDRELSDSSALAILLPTLSEMVGAILTHTLLAWTTYHLVLDANRSSSRPSKVSPKG